MATLADLQFEVERGAKIFKSTTTMPDSSQLGYDGDPNVANTSTGGQTLLYNSPLGTTFVQQNGTKWFKRESTPGGSWVLEGAGGGGTGNVGGITYLSGSEDLDGSWRVRIDDADAYNLERREEGIWLVKTLIENSVHTEQFYVTVPIGGLYFNDGHDRSSMVSSGAVNHHDVLVGNVRGSTTLVSKFDNKPTLTTALTEPTWLVDQFDGVDSYVTDSWGVDFQGFADAMFTDTRVHLAEVPTEDTYARIVFFSTDAGHIISESSDEYLFRKEPEKYGLLITGKVLEFSFVNTIITQVGDNLRIEVTSSRPINLQGVWFVPEGTATSYPHNGGLFFAHGSSKGMPYNTKFIATVEDMSSIDYAEREAERAFTLHDDVLGGLADQDGGYISFNHTDSHAFQQHTSADYAWAKHYGEFGQQNPINTLHLHGNDSMISLMDGDCLSFEPSNVLDTLSVSFMGTPSVDWVNGVQGRNYVVPNLILKFRTYFTNLYTRFDARVTIPSRDDMVIFSFTGTEYNNEQLSMPTTIQIPPIDGSTTIGAITRPPIKFEFTFTAMDGQVKTDSYTLSAPSIPDTRTPFSITSVPLTTEDFGESIVILRDLASTVISGTVNWVGSVIGTVEIFYRNFGGTGTLQSTLGTASIKSVALVSSGYRFTINDLAPGTKYDLTIVVTAIDGYAATFNPPTFTTASRNRNYIDYYPRWALFGPLYVPSEGCTISTIRGYETDPSQVGMPEGSTRVITPLYRLSVPDHVDNFYVHYRGRANADLPLNHFYGSSENENLRYLVENSGVFNVVNSFRISPILDYRIHFSRSPVATGTGNPDNWDASYSYMTD